MLKRGVALVVVVVSLGIQVTACASSSEEEPSAHAAAIGDECQTDADCSAEAYCSKGGLSIGLCTADCDDECATRFGDGHICLPEGCFKLCESPQDCEHRRCYDGGTLNVRVCAGGPIQLLDQCDAEAACPQGTSCEPARRLCVKACTTVLDCFSGQTCLGGYCL